MDLAVGLSIATRQGLPLPGGPGAAAQQRAQLLFAVTGLSVQPPGRLLLDLTTPLIPVGLDVRGSAQHWFIRTADAAKTRTETRWEELFSSQGAWESGYVEPMVTGWRNYLKDTGVTRRGVQLPVVKHRHANRATRAYTKALADWTYAFRDEGDPFYAKLQARADEFAKATEDFLGYVGLGIRSFVGAFSVHIMVLCGNPLLTGVLGNREFVNAFSLPDPPIIPTPLRPFFNQELQALFNRDTFLTLPHPDVDLLNFRLDVILGSYLHPAYAQPPSSFLHLEPRDGGIYLHSHIEEVSTVRRPGAAEWAYPAVYPTVAFVATITINDLFLFALPGDLPLASLTIRVEAVDAPSPRPYLLVYRAPAGLEGHIITDVVPTQTTIAPPGPGETIQLRFVSAAFPNPKPRFVARGHFWVTDTAGQESNHASWLVQAPGPTADRFTRSVRNPAPLAPEVLVYANLLRFGHPGSDPLASFTIVLTTLFNVVGDITPEVLRSDGGDVPYLLRPLFLQPLTFEVPPPGTTWDLLVFSTYSSTIGLPIVFIGQFWVTDSLGVESNHVPWSITVT